jgi:signal transduction histidine kinase
VHVLDAGPESPEILPRLFEPLTSTEGTGLPTFRRIAEGQRGTPSASNRPESGALFAFRLPLRGNSP